MEILGTSPSIQNGNSTNSGAAQGKKDAFGRDTFMQLLVAQMRNQDPINPMDGTKFASQLAQFNSVEQMIQLNDSVDQLAQSQQQLNQSMSNTMAASLAGREVKAYTNQVHLGESGDSQVSFRLRSAADQVEVRILDSNGQVVRKEELDPMASGEHQWSWDGKDNSGNRAENGLYRVEVSAMQGDTEVQALSFIEGLAGRVRYGSDGVSLMVDGVPVSLGDVESVGAVTDQ